MSKKMMIASAMAMAIASLPANADKPAEREKCFGIAKAGKNDCKGGGVTNCASASKKDGEGYLAVPKGLCEKIVGGSLTDPTKK